MSNIGPHLFLW